MWLLAFFLLVAASTAFNICEFKDAMPEFYYSYGNDECPPKFHLEKNGIDCFPFRLDSSICASFCEMRTQFYYGQEQPFLGIPMCRGGETCRITETVHQNYGWKIKTNGNFKEGALTQGITGGYNSKSGTAQTYSFTKILDKDICGYWTFIPFVRESCGTYTAAPVLSPAGSCSTPRYSTGNACIEQLIDLPKGGIWPTIRTVRGLVVFVYVDCLTLGPLADEKQDVAFRQPGVKLPRHYRPAYNDHWNAMESDIIPSNADCAKAEDKVGTGDCLDAIWTLFSAPGNDASLLGIVTSGRCAILNKALKKGDPACKASYLDVAATAQTIFGVCTDKQGEYVGGSLGLMGKSDCFKVSIVKNS